MLAALLGQACTHPGHGLDLRLAHRLPERLAISGVPFFPQEKYQCGPAALAMVLGWTGLDLSPEDLIAEVYTPAREGSLQTALLTAARRRGRLAYPCSGPQNLLDELNADHPVIVLQNLGIRIYPAWHYAVVVGIDRPAGRIVLHTGTRAARPVDWSRFLYTWERSAYWGLVVLPAGRLPAGADEPTYLQAVIGLEQACQWEAAAKAYIAALERWPMSLGALIGLGTCHIMMGNLPAAEGALRRAVEVAPESADAANNLAHVLARRGKRQEALTWSRHAVALGGANRPVYQETLREIETGRLLP